MTKPESVILKEIMLEASKLGWRVFRNHTGGIKGVNGEFHRFGLCKGSSDIIGISPDGRFTAIEVKTPKGRPTQEQKNFINMVNKMGGIGFICDDAKKLKNILDAYN